MADVALPLTDREREGLRDLVYGYVDAMRLRHSPPERVLMSLQQAARDAGLVRSTSRSLYVLRSTESDLLMDDMVRWCITHYFERPV